ncbi:MAG: hypothetical protein HW380_3275 [Magnetococcales bacterium]|nr:hypothetical protein [Magnetococcales bacterium]HIJ85375.1 hypothetical protein [Magnetococcales bacterium]
MMPSVTKNGAKIKKNAMMVAMRIYTKMSQKGILKGHQLGRRRRAHVAFPMGKSQKQTEHHRGNHSTFPIGRSTSVPPNNDQP